MLGARASSGESLLDAARAVYGFYNNGAGVEKPLSVHETLADIDLQQYGEAANGIASAVQQAYEEVGERGDYDAHRTVEDALHTAVEASPFNSRQIARVALSNISTEWVAETSPSGEHVKTLADLVMKSRAVTQESLKLFWWDDALDID